MFCQGVILPLGEPGLVVGARSLLAMELLMLICNAMLHCPCGGGNTTTSGNDVILIAFVCCAAGQTLETFSQPSDPAFLDSTHSLTHQL